MKLLRHLTSLLVTFCTFAVLCPASAAPVRQLRGAYVRTAPGGDLPGLAIDPLVQHHDLRILFERFGRVNLNAVFFEAQSGGAVSWPSVIQPAMVDLTGEGSRSLPYDVFSTANRTAHEQGLDFYAVISPLDLGTVRSSLLYSGSRVRHPAVADADIISVIEGRNWLDLQYGEAYDYVNQLLTEMLGSDHPDGLLISGLDSPVATETQLMELLEEINEVSGSFAPDMILAVQLPSDRESLGRAFMEAGLVDLLVFLPGTGGTLHGINRVAASADAPSSAVMIDSRSLGAIVASLTEINESMLAGFILDRPSLIDPAAAARMFPTKAHMPVLPSRSWSAPEAPEDMAAEYDSDRGSYLISWPHVGSDAKYLTLYTALGGEADIDDPLSELIHRIPADVTEVEYPSPDPGLEFALTVFGDGYLESSPVVSSAVTEELLAAHPEIFRYRSGSLEIGSPKDIVAVDIYSTWGAHAIHRLFTPATDVMIDCGGLPQGVYVVHTRTSDGAVRSNKFIK